MAGYDDENLRLAASAVARSLSRWSVSGKAHRGETRRYSGRVQALRYVRVMAPEDNLVAISCQGNGKSVPYEPAPITVIEALRWFIRHLMFFSTFASLLLQIVHEQRTKLTGARFSCGNVPRDTMLVCTHEHTGTECSGSMRPGNVPLGAFDTRDGENTALLNFTQDAVSSPREAVTVTRSTTS